MNEYGEIIALKDDQAVVMIRRSSACEKCGACEMGSHSDEMLLTVSNHLNGEVGDAVELELPSSQLLKASAITYLIPLGALILGVAVGYVVAPEFEWNPDLTGAVIGILLTAASFLCIRAMEPYFKKNHKFSPRVIKIVKGYRKGDCDDGE
jgi:sigma-E factor negative regulatory protein RseC